MKNKGKEVFIKILSLEVTYYNMATAMFAVFIMAMLIGAYAASNN
jgi:hypothetical protein